MTLFSRMFGRSPSGPDIHAASSRPTHVETLEARQLLSTTVDVLNPISADGATIPSQGLGAADMMTTSALAPVATAAATTPPVPIVRRNYIGTAVSTKHVEAALVLKIRKQDARGSLRGDVRFANASPINI